MRLAIVTHNVIRGDGQSRVSYELARRGIQRGAKVSLLADQVETDLLASGATWVPVKPRLQRVHLFKVWQFAGAADRTLDQLRDQVDVVQAFGFVLNRPHHANNSQFVHDAWGRSPVHTARLRRDFYGAYQRVYTTLNTRWERQAYRQARVVVASSERIRQELIRSGVPEKRIRVILNGVDPREFHPGSADRKALGLPEGVPLALFVGDIRTPRKNLDTVLHALVDVPGVHLAVVGAVKGSAYPDLSRQLGLETRVHFLDFRRDIPQIMRAADAFVFPSRYEACSLVLLEAIASGLPVITAETAGGAEVITPDCGVVLPNPNDTAGLAAALRALVDDPKRRARMGEAARSVAERHSWAHMADRYMQLYQEITA